MAQMIKKPNGVLGKRSSRKWFLTLLIVAITSIGVFLPPVLSVWVFKMAAPLIILSGTEYVSILTLIVSAYYGANVWQKHIEAKSVSDSANTQVVADMVENNSEEA
jgi:hypothetical protein